jgi:hypothetical protein
MNPFLEPGRQVLFLVEWLPGKDGVWRLRKQRGGGPYRRRRLNRLGKQFEITTYLPTNHSYDLLYLCQPPALPVTAQCDQCGELQILEADVLGAVPPDPHYAVLLHDNFDFMEGLPDDALNKADLIEAYNDLLRSPEALALVREDVRKGQVFALLLPHEKEE